MDKITYPGQNQMAGLLKSITSQYVGIIAFFISFLLSPWFYYSWRGLNSDGILYVRLAYLINTYDFNIALIEYDWPFFSVLIATVSNFAHLSYITSAYLLDAVFLGFSALFFVEITKKLGGNVRTQWLAAFVFLSFETVINYRVTIFRDPGYWAFYLSAFYFFLQFAKSMSLKDASLWFFSVATAICFRIEGTMLLLLTPLAVFFFNGLTLSKKFKLYLSLYLPFITLCFIATIIALHEKSLFKIIWNTILNIIKTHIGTLSFISNFLHKVAIFNDNILPPTAKQGSAFIILFSGLTVYFIYKLFLGLGVLNTVMILGTKNKKVIPFETNQKLIFIWILTISLILPYNFIFQAEFINTRYLVSSTITLLLIVPFMLNYGISHPHMSLRSFFSSQKSDNPKKKSIFCLKTLLILYLIAGLGNFTFLFVKEYYTNWQSANVQANIWLTAQRKVLAGIVCSSNTWPVFAVEGEGMSISQVNSHIEVLMPSESHCEYIVLVDKPSRKIRLKMLQESPGWRLVKTFTGLKKERNVYLFQRNH
ncbi:MAG: hypothetical protein HKM04_03330 [Legionellales bacterium]|nr:hypothetical protein [Legionellales bacterium]